MSHYQADNIDSLFLDALWSLSRFGDKTDMPPHNELRGITLVLEDPTKNVCTLKRLAVDYSYGIAQWLFTWYGIDDVATIAGYSSYAALASRNGFTIYGCGQFHRQLAYVLSELRKNRTSTIAVFSFWPGDTLRLEPGYYPKHIGAQFFIRNGALELHVIARHDDLVLTIPTSIFMWTQLQRMMAAELDLKLGWYHHHSMSLILRQNDAERLESLFDEKNEPQGLPSPVVTPHPPSAMHYLLTGIPRGLAVQPMRQLMDGIPPGWNEYARVLLYRKSNDIADLGPFYRSIIE